jgi:hypothetical protein
MNTGFFGYTDIVKASEALYISEEQTANHFKFSIEQWKRHRYDVKTRSSLVRKEKVFDAFALLNKCSRTGCSIVPGSREEDFYFICLQDDQILQALIRDENLLLLPLLIYVFTHELVHIVRFCNFLQRFEVCSQEREEEERVVHETTYNILKRLTLPRMNYVLESYQNHRICDLIVS